MVIETEMETGTGMVENELIADNKSNEEAAKGGKINDRQLKIMAFFPDRT